jgi:predicted permease
MGVVMAHGVFRVVRAVTFQPGERLVFRSVISDVGQALRSLLRAPSFVLLAALTLAVGVGSTTAIFSVVEGVLLRPLPYAEPDELVVLRYEREGRAITNHSEPEIHDYERDILSFAAVAAYAGTSLTLGSASEPERIEVVRATASLLPLLGVAPVAGRVYEAGEDRADASERVVVLSHGLWLRAFGADRGIVGRTVVLEDVPFTVIGVMPEGFAFPDPGVQAWIPLRMDPANPIARNNHYLGVLARLAPGATLRAAQAELDALGARSAGAWPEFYPGGVRFPARPLRDEVVGEVRTPLFLLLAAVVGVLLIASVNAAALFLARGEERRAEIAVRTVLGAGRARVALQLLAESLTVALVAAVVGIALAYGGVVALRALAPPGVPRLDEVAVNGVVLAFGLSVAVATGLLFGLAPAAQALGSDVREVLAAGGRSGMGSRRAAQFRRGLVVAQLSMATTLALSAGLLLRSFQALRRVDLGFRPEGVLVVPLAPPASVVPIDAPAVAFYETLEERIRGLPGVTAVGSAYRVPLASGHDNYSIQVESRGILSIGEAPAPGMQWATPGYFEALGIRLLRGRLFTPADRAGAPLVAVINERLVTELWPGESALGKRLRMFPEGQPWMEVIGVVADVKHYGIRAEPSAKLYIPHLQGYEGGYYSPNRLSLIVRTGADPSGLAGPVRALVREFAPAVPIGNVRPMSEIAAQALARERFTLVLLGGFALVALLLSAVGVYGVIARAVATRTREIGLRMAIGAERAVIARAVLREGLVLAALGCALGLGGGLALAATVRSLLFQVHPADPWTYALTVPVMAVTAVLAGVVPAVRAARLDPVRALRDG